MKALESPSSIVSFFNPIGGGFAAIRREPFSGDKVFLNTGAEFRARISKSVGRAEVGDLHDEQNK